MDRLPEFIFDERRNMLWQLEDDGFYGLAASQDPMGYMRQSLAQLRRVLGSILVPLCVDRRPRDPACNLLGGEPAPGGAPAGECPLAVDVDSLAQAVGKHLDGLGVERVDWLRLGKVGEEGGEVVGAVIKRALGQVGIDAVLAELGDVFLAALGAADQLGVNASAVINQRWRDVRRRTDVGGSSNGGCGETAGATSEGGAK